MAKKYDEQSSDTQATANAAPVKSLSALALEHKHTQMTQEVGRDGKKVYAAAPAVAGDNPHSAAHQSASFLNGWELYTNQTGAEVVLSDEDYLGAIEAAKKGEAHAPANHRPRIQKVSN